MYILFIIVYLHCVYCATHTGNPSGRVLFYTVLLCAPLASLSRCVVCVLTLNDKSPHTKLLSVSQMTQNHCQ